LDDLPQEVRATLIGIMNDARIYDVEAGLIKMALLADANSKIYQTSLEREAESRYKSRHFAEMNKTTATLQKAAEMRVEAERNQVWAETYQKYAITYPCSVCGKLITIVPGSESHRAILGYLQEQGWAHAECLKRAG
jgi:hypothetical protein